MHNRVKTINKCYNNLEYRKNNKKKEALIKISNLFKELKFEDTDTVAIRFLHTASLIEKHLNLFMIVCQHVDVATSILNYFYYFGTICMFNSSWNFDDRIYISICAILTIFNIYKEESIQEFLETAIIMEPQIQTYYKFKKNASHQTETMILLEESDLHAVINYLKFKNINGLHKIWIHESIAQTFMWHFKKCFGCLYSYPIHIFQLKQELITCYASKCNIYMENKINITSIWSEDIIAAKNLARTLNQQIIFINTHMDICPDVILTHFNTNLKSLFWFSDLQETCTNPTHKINSTCNLFYNGMWQKPKKNTYWIHKNILLANVTREDVLECIDSAQKGFITWSTMPSESKMQILSNFANTLECNGKFLLANIVLKWIKMSYIAGKTIDCYQNKRFEVIQIRKPQGTIILKEKDEITLFRELTQSLIIGNSVIVICDPDLCILAAYCDMFKISGIPPGVINLLSGENLENVQYTNFANSTSTEACDGLTVIQCIVTSRQ
ncbi:uncharacterized protein LOC126851561 [Cataglyphis hispanica]|uniref:uncharacterized protein LOC126851561 n=1 Tax=Cataglyphis hispanica TaxID=1086592 RepID=UPI00218016D0|nr:uncharacterized protein LOC126851561 [Cataglyphis hispanica]